jgi:hypothetical protein
MIWAVALRDQRLVEFDEQVERVADVIRLDGPGPSVSTCRANIVDSVRIGHSQLLRSQRVVPS